MLGERDHAISALADATSVLQSLGHRADLGRLHCGLGYLHRRSGDSTGALDAFRNSEAEFAAVEMKADVAAVQLVIADLLLDTGQERQAEWEIRQALPIIEEYKLVPEGMAALALLRESLRRQKIDRSALRNLHGYFEELKT
jgi:hypothetical protein